MRGVNQSIKIFALGTMLLFSGVASAQMLDDETYGNLEALEVDTANEQVAPSNDNLMLEIPVASDVSSAAEKSETNNIITAPQPDVAENSSMVSWSNDTIPPEHIYDIKEVREDADGVVREVATGKLITGEVREHYPRGRVLSKVRYVDGVRHGRSLMFFQNGTLLSESFYKDGKEEGDVSIFYRNGDEFIRVTFKDGVPALGYCMTSDGERIDMTTAQLREFQDNGNVPCSSKR